MKALATRIDGLVLVELTAHEDDRGFFRETFREDAMAQLGVDAKFVQDNHSRSAEGVVRGLHFQVGEGQSKLVCCTRGSIFDVVVDLRRDSPHYGQWESVELSDENHRVLYVPVGFAHGFCATSEAADVLYKCSSYYAPELEKAIAFDDPAIGIEWPMSSPIASDRDRAAPTLAEIAPHLPFRYSP